MVKRIKREEAVKLFENNNTIGWRHKDLQHNIGKIKLIWKSENTESFHECFPVIPLPWESGYLFYKLN
jgi:hypothetical protein